MTGFDGEAYFFADGSNGVTGQWESDGTPLAPRWSPISPGQERPRVAQLIDGRQRRA